VHARWRGAAAFEPDEKFLRCAGPDEKRVLAGLRTNRVCARSARQTINPRRHRTRRIKNAAARRNFSELRFGWNLLRPAERVHSFAHAWIAEDTGVEHTVP
jgi:hypothetical protein